jgi:AcrR family transcriptional regulator
MHALDGKASRSAAAARKGSLRSDDWVAAANELLASENVQGVQVAALCQRLGVTKGSFYWHFSGREALLRGLLDSWRRRMTIEVVSRVSRAALGAGATLRSLLSLPRRAFSARGTSIEMSVRDWARRDATAHQALQEVDQIRLEFFEQIFRQLQFSAPQARLRAYLAYSIMMGDSMLKDTLGAQVSTDELVETAVALLSGPAPPACGAPGPHRSN